MRKFEGYGIMPQGMFSRQKADSLPNCFNKMAPTTSMGVSLGTILYVFSEMLA